MKATTIPLEQYEREVSSLKEENAFLKEQIEWFKRQIFGQKTDKFVDDNSQQLYFEGFDQLVPVTSLETVSSHQRQKRQSNRQDKIKLPADIPIECQILDIPEEAKICSETGEFLIKIGDEISSKLAYRPGSYFIKQIIRPKYALSQKTEGGILTAPLPDSLLNRCQADESLLADILVKKFGDHLPLYRQSEIMARDGIHISRQILSKWVLRTAIALKPLYEVMKLKILQSGNIFYDETPLDMLEPGKGKTHQAYMWVLVGGNTENPSYRIYDFCKDRCHHHAATMVRNYCGVLHSDKYGAYEILASKK